MCEPCTASGSCPVGFFFSAVYCDGNSKADSSCRECRTVCPDHQYLNPENCQGDQTADDACEDCTLADTNCFACKWSVSETSPMCTECMTGYTLQSNKTCVDETMPVVSGCPADQVLRVRSFKVAVVLRQSDKMALTWVPLFFIGDQWYE